MRSHERNRGLLRAPGLMWDVLVKGRYAFIYDQMAMASTRMSIRKRLNLVRAGANLLHRRLNPWSMPLHMQFELTNYCNLRCPVCPAGTDSINRTPLAMDVALFERLMGEVGPYLLTASLWAWGEPLLHPRLKEMLRVARRHDVVTLLSTNGQVLGQEPVLESLLEEPPHYLIVALDGLTDDTNSQYRVGARMASVLEGVKKLSEMKRRLGLRYPILNMRYIVMKHNQHEAALLDGFAARHGFELLTIRRIYFLESTTDEAKRERLAPEPDASASWDRPRPGRFICMEPFWFPTVFSDGTLALCEQDYNAELAVGRIEGDVSFTRLWRSERAARLRQKIRDGMETVSFCRKCHYAGRPITDCNVEARVVRKEVCR